MFHVAGCGIALQSVLRLVPMHVLPMFDELAVLQHHAVGPRHRDVPGAHHDQARGRAPALRGVRPVGAAVVVYGAAPIDAALLDQAMRAFPGTASRRCTA
jgi:hypothetical protein